MQLAVLASSHATDTLSTAAQMSAASLTSIYQKGCAMNKHEVHAEHHGHEDQRQQPRTRDCCGVPELLHGATLAHGR
jgi:hypothetical protein